MGLIKFITVFDDEKQTLLYEDIMRLYNISSWPSAYYFDNKTMIDGINTDSVTYCRHKNEIDSISGPNIPSKVFQEAINIAYQDGFTLALIICPNKKWYPYYYDAVKAVNRVKRSTKMDFTTFNMRVVDTKNFAAGSLYYALQLARLHENHHCPTGIILEDAKGFASRTIVLTTSGECFGFRNGELAAFRVFGKRFYTDINLTQSSDYVKFNKFSECCAKYIRCANAKYIVSVGAECDFAGNIIGRIEKILGYPPSTVVQYGIASADIFGLKSVCIHF